ncbi:MAG: DivIVA domain-containing protein [Clostridium sp.]|nr:DivIVA domain-containing protein [Clostridium sp.]MCM1209628.1 DivIVA domain-containing protein [Ruminococcus sp.]
MIQPIDIKTHKFKKGILGYKSADVDSFIDTVYRAYEEIFKENEKLSNDLEKLNASLQDNRLKMFELENRVQNSENVSSHDNSEAKKQADQIIKNAEKAAADIIANAKKESAKYEEAPKPKFEEKKVEPVKEEPKESASSRFFKKAEEEVHAAAASSASSGMDDDDEVFVGEIEEARKGDRMMIGDGEEEEDMDFEFL